jgi:hypothetical protein
MFAIQERERVHQYELTDHVYIFKKHYNYSPFRQCLSNNQRNNKFHTIFRSTRFLSLPLSDVIRSRPESRHDTWIRRQRWSHFKEWVSLCEDVSIVGAEALETATSIPILHFTRYIWHIVEHGHVI